MSSSQHNSRRSKCAKRGSSTEFSRNKVQSGVRTSVVQFEMDCKRSDAEMEPTSPKGARGLRNAKHMKGNSEQVTNLVLSRKGTLSKRGKFFQSFSYTLLILVSITASQSSNGTTVEGPFSGDRQYLHTKSREVSFKSKTRSHMVSDELSSID